MAAHRREAEEYQSSEISRIQSGIAERTRLDALLSSTNARRLAGPY